MFSGRLFFKEPLTTNRSQRKDCNQGESFVIHFSRVFRRTGFRRIRQQLHIIARADILSSAPATWQAVEDENDRDTMVVNFARGLAGRESYPRRSFRRVLQDCEEPRESCEQCRKLPRRSFGRAFLDFEKPREACEQSRNVESLVNTRESCPGVLLAKFSKTANNREKPVSNREAGRALGPSFRQSSLRLRRAARSL